MNREEIRMQLWCDAYNAAMRHTERLGCPFESYANSAIELFDAAFPKPTFDTPTSTCKLGD
jgi:hypothetical protein